MKLHGFMNFTFNKFPQSFSELKDDHVGVKHQVKGKGSTECVDTYPQVCRNLRCFSWRRFYEVCIIVFLNFKDKSVTVTRTYNFREQLLIDVIDLFHLNFVLIDPHSCCLYHTKHGKPYNVMEMEATEKEGPIGKLFA
ncbi:hypothetical protein GDO81_026004 [Engystomops pustulosus]|uniref:Uncharacterized protein n=1 Tax=Engystomops pustulosus TaxID=76066 RepID=A0AAV6YGM1_ENGPU|nr:hypothetical protein GDO81_026004 [Engystomops pustulosus]